jgi:enoyl-CoA hydratase/carnithine racemase
MHNKYSHLNPLNPLEIGRDGDIAIITVNRSNRRNALTSEIRRALTSSIINLSKDTATIAIVLASKDSAFSSGQDLEEAKDFPVSSVPSWIEEHMDLYKAILRYPRPILAAVDGCCVGAGLQLALLCDLRLGSSSAYFVMPELDDAIPCILGVWTLWSSIGRTRTYEMVLTNRSIIAQEALQWGILNHLVDSPDELIKKSLEMAHYLASKPTIAFGLTKRWLAELTLDECERLATHASFAHMQAFASGEPHKAMIRFLEGDRREVPQWLVTQPSNTHNNPE